MIRFESDLADELGAWSRRSPPRQLTCSHPDRRRPSSRRPGRQLERDRRCWSSSILIGVSFAAVAMLFSLIVLPAAEGLRGWWVPQDVWFAFDGGRYVWNGALGYVYKGTSSVRDAALVHRHRAHCWPVRSLRAQ